MCQRLLIRFLILTEALAVLRNEFDAGLPKG
jgi:hypothetical protein